MVLFVPGEVWRQTTNPDGSRGKAYTTTAAQWNAAYPDVAKLEARLDKLPKLESEDWQAREARRAKLRIAKQRLTLKLAGLHQEMAVSKSLKFKPHPESPNNTVARAPHGEYEISPTSAGMHRLDYYAESGDHPTHTEKFRSRSSAEKYANIHHSKVTSAGVR